MSSKVIDIYTNRKLSINFLLVINSNFGRMLHRCRDFDAWSSKFARFAYPTLLWGPHLGEPLRISGWNLPPKNQRDGATVWWKLCDPSFNRFWRIHPCDRQTDRQTDRRTDGIAMAYTHYSIYAVARKYGVSGSFTFCKSKLHMIYINLLSNSMFEDLFHRDIVTMEH